MPIVGLTDRGPSLPPIGTLRKGAPKPQSGPGQDLKHFRFDTEDAEAAARFKEIYGAEPCAIRVFLPFSTTDENFEAWREEWTASSLKHRCDGQMMVRWLQPNGTYSDIPKPCPGGCKQVGRLKVIIPELKRWAFVTALTTSIHDIMQLHANLLALESARGDLRGIPLILKRAPRKISTPRGNGERKRAEKWLLTIEAQPQWVELQLAAQEREALAEGQRLALPPAREDRPWFDEEFEEEKWEGEGEQIEAADSKKPVKNDYQEACIKIIDEMRHLFLSQGRSESDWMAEEVKLWDKTPEELNAALVIWKKKAAANGKKGAAESMQQEVVKV